MRFTISENRATGRRVQFSDGKIIVSKMKDTAMLTAEEQKLVAEAHVDPMAKLAKIEEMVKSGKVDPKALEAILTEKVDFDALATEQPPA